MALNYSSLDTTLTLFKYPADKKPVLIILLFSVIDFTAYFMIENLWVLIGFWLLMIVPKGVISAWNHHHQHCHVFKPNWMNRVLEFFYALHTGVTTNLWVLHHNLGHHRNFLDQSKDESRWKRQDGSTMGALEYTLSVTLTAYPRGYQVGKHYPKLQKQFVTYGLITFALLTALTIYNPLNALFIFILPMIGSLLYTSWATYGHHTGLDTDDQFAGSHNITEKWFNVLTGNLGFHTAHHFKQGVHWSKLPALHEEIKGKIPEECFKKSFFDVFAKIKQSKQEA
ncbi:MAG: fatty acid desaturase [Gammaproteobacteria bacterium]|nr:fatty acid desaturase [Gammaproteobacteria bacterium]